MSRNRPMGVQDVVSTLAPRYEKGVVQSMLDGLELSGVLVSKAVIGSQKLYWPDQAKVKSATADELRSMAQDARDAGLEAKELAAEASGYERRAAARLAQPTSDDIDGLIAAELAAVETAEGKLRKRGAAKPVTLPQMKKACKSHNDNRALWLKRKRAFKEVAEVVADNMDKKPKDFIKTVADDQCVETDEDVGVKLPPPDALPVPSG